MMWRSTATHLPNYYATRLNTDRLTLRPPHIRDYTEWHDVRKRNQSYLQPFEPIWAENALTLPSYKAKLAQQKQNWIRDTAYAFLILAPNDQQVIGGININHIARGAAQHGTLGYWLDQAQQGCGYMTEALQAIIEFARNGLSLNRLHAATLPHNNRSRNLLTRTGFTEEGYACNYASINGVWADHTLYGFVL